MAFKNIRLTKYNVTLFKEPTWDWKDPRLKYVIFGVEKCPSTGKKHWQGYVELNSSVRAPTVKKWFKGNPRLSMKPIKKREYARNYCMKGDQTKEEWERLNVKGPNYGKNADYKECGTWRENIKTPNVFRETTRSLADGDITVEEVMDQQPMLYCRYRNGLEALGYRSAKIKARKFRKVEVVIEKDLHKAYQDHPDAYRLEDGALWWDGYDNEETIIIDDFVGIWKPRFVISLLKGKPMTKLPIKGGHKWAVFTRVIIVSDIHRSYWYNGEIDKRLASMLPTTQTAPKKVKPNKGTVL